MYEAMDDNSWNDAEQLAMRAYELYENGEHQEALEQLEEAIDINPDNASWFFNAGLTLDAMDQFKSAIKAYEQALEIKPGDPEIMNSLAVDYTRIGQYDLAIEIFEKIQNIAADFEPCYCNRIITYTEMDQHAKAEHMFYMAQQINPDCPICFYNIGNSLFSQQEYKRAIWCWKRTQELEPTHPQINYRIAQAYWADGDSRQGRDYFLKELRANSGDIGVILDFGLFLLDCGQIDSAREKFNRILELSPENARARMYLGEIELSLENCTRAAGYFLDAAETDPSLPGPRYRLAQIAMESGDDTKALGLLKAELRLDIEDPDVLNSVGTMFMKFGDFDSAMDCFLRVVDQDPLNGRAFHYMGKALAMQTQYDGAVHFFEYAMDIGYRSMELYTDAIETYVSFGEYALAEKTAVKALKFAPDDKRIRKLQGRIKKAKFAGRVKDMLKRCFLEKPRLFAAKQRCRVRQMVSSKDE